VDLCSAQGAVLPRNTAPAGLLPGVGCDGHHWSLAQRLPRLTDPRRVGRSAQGRQPLATAPAGAQVRRFCRSDLPGDRSDAGALRPGRRRALLASANTKLFLHLVDPATRQWACQSVGEHEVEIRSVSENLDYQIGKGRASMGASRQVQSVLVESQFRIPRQQGVLQLPAGYPAAWVSLRDDHIRQRGGPRHPGYVPLDMSQTLWGRSPPAPVEVATTLEQGPV